VKISGIGITVSELGRAREIIGVAVKYGFNDWVTKSGLGKFLVSRKHLAKIEQFNKWERMRMAIEELGPTFIKFGQILADRPDVVPEGLREELKKLQDEAVPMPDEETIAEIEKELNRPVDEVFREFDRTHLASASIAQTYRAVLLDGQEVCVKIRRTGIEKKILLDLNLMNFFSARAQKSNPDIEAINLVGVVHEFGKTITQELDFKNEATNLTRFRHDFENEPDIYVPAVYKEFTTERFLVEEFIHGTKVSEMGTLLSKNHDPEELARKCLKLVFMQIFRHGFFHADPHPGNIFIREGDVVSFIDYGMMGTLRPEHIQFLGQYVLGYVHRDAHEITEALLLLSGKRTFSRFRDLEFQLSEMLAHYKYLTIDEMDFGKVMNESVDIIVHYGLRIPPSIYLLVKSLITIERVAVGLYPKIDFAKEIQPFATELIRQQINPKRFARDVFEAIKEYYKLIMELPSELNEIIYKIKEGRFKTMIEVKGFEPLVDHIDIASNRVSIAIVLAALIIGASLLSQFPGTRWLGIVIFILAAFFGFWLVIKLFRKNRL
jgi:ubiquinone biosynthesis protein